MRAAAALSAAFAVAAVAYTVYVSASGGSHATRTIVAVVVGLTLAGIAAGLAAGRGRGTALAVVNVIVGAVCLAVLFVVAVGRMA